MHEVRTQGCNQRFGDAVQVLGRLIVRWMTFPSLTLSTVLALVRRARCLGRTMASPQRLANASNRPIDGHI